MLMKTNVPWNERTARYLQIRRCSSCRLRRCFEMGMREELVRSEAENERHKQLVDINRKRREMFKQQLLEIQQLSFPPVCIFMRKSPSWVFINDDISNYFLFRLFPIIVNSPTKLIGVIYLILSMLMIHAA